MLDAYCGHIEITPAEPDFCIANVKSQARPSGMAFYAFTRWGS